MPLTINDTTAYSGGPYYVSGVGVVAQTFTFSITGGSGGPYTWTVGELDPTTAIVDAASSDTGTGATFTFDGDYIAAGSVSFLIELTDASAPSAVAYKTVGPLTVLPAAFPVRSGAGNLEDADAFHLVQANTPGGGFTLTLNVSASGRGYMWWTVKNTGTGVLTINQTSGETINGAASITVAAGASVTLYPDNNNTWMTA